MFYWLANFSDTVSALNVFRYITTRTGGAMVTAGVFVFLFGPWVIDPLFNKFEPLDKQHPELVTAIQELTQQAGVPIPRDRIFLMRASEKSNEINAYVTGIGTSKRVVVWDTTIQKTSYPEALFIIGHELGHYVLGHVWKGFLFGAAGLLGGLIMQSRDPDNPLLEPIPAAAIELAEQPGLRYLARVVNCPADELVHDMPVELRTH